MKNYAPSVVSGNIERLSWLRRTFSLFFSKPLKKFLFIRWVLSTILKSNIWNHNVWDVIEASYSIWLIVDVIWSVWKEKMTYLIIYCLTRLTYFFAPDKNHFFLENKILESHHPVSLSKKLVRIGYHILRYSLFIN